MGMAPKRPAPQNHAQAPRVRAERSGRFAESLCCFWLRIKGYRILARRYRGPGGEIDILARKANVLVAIEVKYRKTRTDALFAISPRQQGRIAQSLQAFAARTGHAGDMRMDVMTVSPKGRIHHHINVWMG
ncbi:YraN family protein [Thalassospira sp. TSL5-1]|uniref:YraN family protein n=1 Tax=Thalassospira sp. TSL5-1 TaxID=1544451 RepID=UPI000A537709|nr:YraN family protein [Thalassospira sp. TSL5-1]